MEWSGVNGVEWSGPPRKILPEKMFFLWGRGSESLPSPIEISSKVFSRLVSWSRLSWRSERVSDRGVVRWGVPDQDTKIPRY